MRKITRKFLATVLSLSLLAGFSASIASFASSESWPYPYADDDTYAGGKCCDAKLLNERGNYRIYAIGKLKIMVMCDSTIVCIAPNLDEYTQEEIDKIETIEIPNHIVTKTKEGKCCISLKTIYNLFCLEFGDIREENRGKRLDEVFPNLKTIIFSDSFEYLLSTKFPKERIIEVMTSPNKEFYCCDWGHIKFNEEGKLWFAPDGNIYMRSGESDAFSDELLSMV